jgi:hypothetical protein
VALEAAVVVVVVRLTSTAAAPRVLGSHADQADRRVPTGSGEPPVGRYSSGSGAPSGGVGGGRGGALGRPTMGMGAGAEQQAARSVGSAPIPPVVPPQFVVLMVGDAMPPAVQKAVPPAVLAPRLSDFPAHRHAPAVLRSQGEGPPEGGTLLLSPTQWGEDRGTAAGAGAAEVAFHPRAYPPPAAAGSASRDARPPAHPQAASRTKAASTSLEGAARVALGRAGEAAAPAEAQAAAQAGGKAGVPPLPRTRRRKQVRLPWGRAHPGGQAKVGAL